MASEVDDTTISNVLTKVREQAASLARYHEERAACGVTDREFHERARTFLEGSVPVLVDEIARLQARLLEALRNPPLQLIKLDDEQATIFRLTRENSGLRARLDAYVAAEAAEDRLAWKPRP